eukprot:363445-Prorocentrum_minimum.AAC.2
MAVGGVVAVMQGREKGLREGVGLLGPLGPLGVGMGRREMQAEKPALAKRSSVDSGVVAK